MANVSRHFTFNELCCSHCGELPKDYGRELANKLEALRAVVGFPLVITSGYRCPMHELEISKPDGATHAHTRCHAADIQVSHGNAADVIFAGLSLGARGLGVSQKGNMNTRFIHLDWRKTDRKVWGY